MTVLVTGGAGYIGSHVVRLLRERGTAVVIADDLSNGVHARTEGIPTLEIDLATDATPRVLRDFIAQHAVDSLIHFAARKQVGESVQRPAWYYSQNVGSLANVLMAIEGTPVDRVVFSSSAAVYGEPDTGAVAEDDPTRPINPYGETKLVGEQLLAGSVTALGISVTSLRYFNVAGAGWPDLGDTAVQNLVPMVFERLDAGDRPKIFGDDYPTPDGTCIRDYIHVLDLAEAHLAALDHLEARRGKGEAPAASVFNVGTGEGSSVREVVDAIARASGTTLEPEVLPRRAGDPPMLVADPARIREVLGWQARHGLDDIVASAWQAHTAG
ncbi:UDP-glucose 4-epimerase GalE [Salinibacterium sp. dk2585]|uniref:UDP-glucose 4-epimerase GalE n=1 Tax=unclassified Salinibacterium TaxID=2632331 RepID=UPI0011C24C5F|nr:MULTISPECIES: UDP-glucose 4-epimerase GalE [unclassified Salinibacterium]QEE60860.1 UDP-glucose 4-epimerase GalE [Salinibacterium sp. dk2585]TXK55932.1 UDP-glucose 4-epimerase GalE [Salinibacterium sp. dk5596]